MNKHIVSPFVLRLNSVLPACLFVLLFQCTALFAQNASLDTFIEQELEAFKVPGLAVALLKEGEVIYQQGFGMADLKKKTPITTATPFMLGSVTKQFTAMGIMILVEKGQVNLDEPVRTYLPELPEAYEAVTVRHMLTHTSGIKRDFKKRSKKPFYNETVVGDQLYVELSNHALEFEPGSKISYSNTGYGLLYMMIERISGEPYADFLQTHIFEPLGMTSTVSRDHENNQIEGLAVGYALPKKRFVKVAPVLRLGGGSLVSTVEDMAKWDAALHSDILVKSTTLDQIWTPQILKGGKVADMGRDGQGRHFKSGFGWFIGDESDRRLVHHSGGVDGFASHIDRYLKDKITVIVLTNIETPTPSIMARKIADFYFEGE